MGAGASKTYCIHHPGPRESSRHGNGHGQGSRQVYPHLQHGVHKGLGHRDALVERQLQGLGAKGVGVPQAAQQPCLRMQSGQEAAGGPRGEQEGPRSGPAHWWAVLGGQPGGAAGVGSACKAAHRFSLIFHHLVQAFAHVFSLGQEHLRPRQPHAVGLRGAPLGGGEVQPMLAAVPNAPLSSSHHPTRAGASTPSAGSAGMHQQGQQTSDGGQGICMVPLTLW